ncbi:MAG: hypothetical protein EXS39_05740 [Opitutaceae bacterium]|nr:hypothetical protein [Opitutaceae bacterium]
MQDDLHKIPTNPEVFPVELTLTSGEKIRIPHPDYVFYSQKMGRIIYFPPDRHSIFEMILPKQIAKIRANKKKSAA